MKKRGRSAGKRSQTFSQFHDRSRKFFIPQRQAHILRRTAEHDIEIVARDSMNGQMHFRMFLILLGFSSP
jgi:hypothetical protein